MDITMDAAAATLLCRSRMGTPLSMYPPGRLIFVRPIKSRMCKEWDAVWIQPEDIIGAPASREDCLRRWQLANRIRMLHHAAAA